MLPLHLLVKFYIDARIIDAKRLGFAVLFAGSRE